METLKELLQESGFTKEEQEQFLTLNHKEQDRYIISKRKEILDKVHKQERQIMNLDYLKYKMEKNK